MNDDLYAGVDLGGTTITAGIAAADGRIGASRTVSTGSSDGPDIVLGRIALLLEALAADAAAAVAAAWKR